MIKIESVIRPKGVPQSVSCDVSGTHIRFVMHGGKLTETCRYKQPQSYDYDGMSIPKMEYAKLVKQVTAIFKGNKE